MSRGRSMRAWSALVSGGLLLAGGMRGAAQDAAGSQTTAALPNGKVGGSSNMHLVAHVPLGGRFRVSDADLEQELSRPYAYVTQTRDRPGLTIPCLKDM